MKMIISLLIAKLIRWCSDEDRSTNEIFNSIRLNALINELSSSGIVNPKNIEKNMADAIYKIIDNKI